MICVAFKRSHPLPLAKSHPVKCPRSGHPRKDWAGLGSHSSFVTVFKSLKVTRVRKLPGGRSTVNWGLEQGPVAGSGPRPVLKWYSGATPRELIETSAERIMLEQKLMVRLKAQDRLALSERSKCDTVETCAFLCGGLCTPFG